MAVIGVVYGQRIIDSVIASNFSAAPRVASVKQSLELTDRAKTIFYASQPSIEDKQHFNDSCKSTERTTAMLGCYYRRQIYLFDVTNNELAGAVEVTAAHELLHAAYERLPFYEKPKIDTLVERQYEKVKDQKAIKSLVAYYEKAEPGAVPNELHSIIGTTISSLDPELETYYARYFTDRRAIVAMNERYSAVFQKVQDEADSLSTQIKSEGPAIEAALAQYEADRKQLESDITVFNERAAGGGFSSQSSFQVARSSLVARVATLSAERESINRNVDTYNKLVEQLRALSVRSDELNKSINGISAPETKL